MENLTIVGMKEINQKMSKIERSLDGIDKSLAKIEKILNRQVPNTRPVLSHDEYVAAEGGYPDDDDS